MSALRWPSRPSRRNLTRGIGLIYSSSPEAQERRRREAQEASERQRQLKRDYYRRRRLT